MATPRFQNYAEEAYAAHLTLTGLAFNYEQPWGKARPDFTIVRPSARTAPIAIADVKQVRNSPAEEALLEAGAEVSIKRNPAVKTRWQINDVWPQFQACDGYPCILVLASGGDTLPEPVSVMAAMLGDYTLLVHVSKGPSDSVKITQGFGAGGKMINKEGRPANMRISAIGLMSTICPDEVYSGYVDQVRKLASQYLPKGGGDPEFQRYVAACMDLKAALMAEGYELETFATQVEYVINPLAEAPFPRADLVRGYVKVWEYDLATSRLSMTYDWAARPKP